MKLITQGKTNWKFILIILVLAILVGGGVWWCVKNQKISQPTETMTPQKIQDETADWQTYKNEEYGFEMKYPKDWEKSEWPYGKFEELFFDVGFSETVPAFWQGNFRIEILPNPNQLSLEEWMKNYKRESATGADLIREIINTTLDGKIAKRVSVFNFDSTRIEIIIINKISVYNLSFSDVPEGNDPDNSRHQQIYSQMLSAFRFLE